MSTAAADWGPPDARGVRRCAALSADGRYRYTLGRRWADSGALLTFVMLNPSTADADVDDATIRRCTGFARREQFAGLWVVNLLARRTSSPAVLTLEARAGLDVLGPLNSHALWQALSSAHCHGAPLVAAWGAYPETTRLGGLVDGLRLLSDGVGGVDWRCLGVTGTGAPRHPLRLRADTPLLPYTV